MIVLPLFKKIEKPLIVSNKYGIVLSNLLDDDKCFIYKAIKRELEFCDREYNFKGISNLINSHYYKDTFINAKSNNSISLLCDNLVCLYTTNNISSFLKFKNEFTENPTCEISNEEKFLSLFNFLDFNTYKLENKKTETLENILISSHKDRIITSDLLLNMEWKIDSSLVIEKYSPHSFKNHFVEYNYKINALLNFGINIDTYIKNENDFFIIDYIMDIIHDIEYSNPSIVMLFSLFETILASTNYKWLRKELIKKVPQFVPDNIEDKELWIKTIYNIRCKLAHGDYFAFRKEIELYNRNFLKNFNFDYYEFSHITWIRNAVFSDLEVVISNVIWMMLNVPALIKKIKAEIV